MEYGGFEGIIPKGQYGGGTVMVWDQGTWEPQAGHTDVDAGTARRDPEVHHAWHEDEGQVGVDSHGWKGREGAKPNWLLIKEHDAFERAKESTPCYGELSRTAW